MEHPCQGMSIKQIADLPGVVDLKPLTAKGQFALALKYEAIGDHIKTQEKLDAAVAAVIA